MLSYGWHVLQGFRTKVGRYAWYLVFLCQDTQGSSPGIHHAPYDPITCCTRCPEWSSCPPKRQTPLDVRAVLGARVSLIGTTRENASRTHTYLTNNGWPDLFNQTWNQNELLGFSCRCQVQVTSLPLGLHNSSSWGPLPKIWSSHSFAKQNPQIYGILPLPVMPDITNCFICQISGSTLFLVMNLKVE